MPHQLHLLVCTLVNWTKHGSLWPNESQNTQSLNQRVTHWNYSHSAGKIIHFLLISGLAVAEQEDMCPCSDL